MWGKMKLQDELTRLSAWSRALTHRIKDIPSRPEADQPYSKDKD
jgi:hypothetical protein